MGFYRFLFMIIYLLLASNVYAQRVEKVRAEYIYHAPENISLEEAKQITLERAKIQAIAECFGSIVSQDNSTIIRNIDEKSRIDFFSYGGSEVKGEWIETIGEPSYNISYEQGVLVIEVIVEGRIREIVSARVDFNVKVLCNGDEERFEQETFKNGDDLFLSFQSPVEGYLAVYLLDESQYVYCLLPYKKQLCGSFPIKAGNTYVFFSRKKSANCNIADVDEYVLTCSKEVERNRLYIIFSPNLFARPIDNNAEFRLPRKLEFASFQKWLAKSRKLDKDMQVETKAIIIKQ